MRCSPNQDLLFALAPERGFNNGSPSLHARWLHHAALRPGLRVAHIGAGTGYYTALIARLVGGAGRVTAVEFDARLAGLARANLAHLPNVRVVEGDGAAWPREETDCVYVNFSVERPAGPWLESLAPGGRLLFPLGVPLPDRDPRTGRHALHGAALRVERPRDGGGGGGDAFAVRWLGPAFFVCAEGGEGEIVAADADREALKAAFERGGVESVRSLRWKAPGPAGRAWFAGSGWSLGFNEAG